MKAKLVIDIHGLIDVVLYPESKAEKLILERLSEVQKTEITKQVKETNYYVEKPELLSVTIGEIPA